jgi:uncharacterized YigZ family protein
MENDGYLYPKGRYRAEIEVQKSIFIATIDCVQSIEAARNLLTEIRNEMPDASHHVYAYVVGFGKSVVEGLSDAGEPNGTAGQPVMAVLRGSNLGDSMIIITRYFGGILLGTGGLVRAYTNAAKAVVAGVQTTAKISLAERRITLSYSSYEPVRRLMTQFNVTVIEQTFEADITLSIRLPVASLHEFTDQLIDLCAGNVTIALD